jgi:hypothetical protein
MDGAPTFDQIRRPMLCPTELQAQQALTIHRRPWPRLTSSFLQVLPQHVSAPAAPLPAGDAPGPDARTAGPSPGSASRRALARLGDPRCIAPLEAARGRWSCTVLRFNRTRPGRPVAARTVSRRPSSASVPFRWRKRRPPVCGADSGPSGKMTRRLGRQKPRSRRIALLSPPAQQQPGMVSPPISRMYGRRCRTGAIQRVLGRGLPDVYGELTRHLSHEIVSCVGRLSLN